MNDWEKPGRGFVLGKFMPPHLGHIYLCEFAANYVRELTVLVCSLPNDSIPGERRFAWMKELLPDSRVLWCNQILPQVPEDDPANFWNVWRGVVKRFHPEPIDMVFASDAYGAQLGAEVGARFVPCDPHRQAVPVSGTKIRADPYANWRYLPPPVRRHYLKRVCVFGPEASGKSTLAQMLADQFQTALVPEYGRTYTETFGTTIMSDDLRLIVQGHRASVAAASRLANCALIEDTDPVLTSIWSQMLLGARDSLIDAFDDYADLYLLCDVDFPWVDDGTRYFSRKDDRERFFQLCKAELERRKVRYITVSGSPGARLERATAAINGLLGVRRNAEGRA